MGITKFISKQGSILKKTCLVVELVLVPVHETTECPLQVNQSPGHLVITNQTLSIQGHVPKPLSAFSRSTKVLDAL